MKLFKNEVGRPSNETLKKRKIFITIICAVVLLVVVGTVYLLSGNNLTRLRGDGTGVSVKYAAGDVDGNAKLTIDDAERILKHVYGISKFKNGTKAYKSADRDGNGKINVKDAIKVLKDLNIGYKPGDVDKNVLFSWNDVEMLKNRIYIYNSTLKKGSEDKLYEATPYYDINGDNVINNTDVRLLYRAVSGGYQAGDVTKDGKVNYKDVNKMIELLDIQDGGDLLLKIADLNYDRKITKEDVDLVYRLALRTNGAKEILPGDLNQDGRITQADATFVMNYVRGTIKLTASQKKYADINNDGKVNTKDAVYILNLISSY